ncbi:MAG: hypothetical protein QM499_04635 [Flavobacteriaceae bacterium]
MIKFFKLNCVCLIITLLFLTSCNKDRLITKTEYFENGNIRVTHLLKNGKNIDSSIYYFNNVKTTTINQIRYWKDSTSCIKLFDKNEILLSEGEIKNKDINFRIGFWKFYKKNGNTNIVEYKNINDKSYFNQNWVVKNKDTLTGRGNFFDSFFIRDTISLGEFVKVHFYLQQPYFSRDSDIEIILPKYDLLLNDDFSNLYDIETFTYQSLKNDGIPHPDIPEEYYPINHDIEFGLQYTTPGEKRIRGVLIENNNKNKFDSLEYRERRLFFDKTFFIKDTVK